ncbi:MAG: hypothetical protein NXH85_02715 [Pseudomonadaceae bacterium]|nr:hypothetical protein [Pseudomonadaceae bacterium]
MLHQFLSQQGGLLAITLMTLSVVTDRASLENNQARAIAVAGLLAIGALLIYGLPAQAVISSGLLLTIAATILATWTGWRRSLGAGLFLLVFANGALVRQSDFLSAPAAWHIYHGLLSVFALGYTRLFSVSAGYPPAKDAQQAH